MDRAIIFAALAVGVMVYLGSRESESEDPQDEDLIDMALTKIDEATAGAGQVDGMTTSSGMLSMLKRREALSLSRYQLDDGGYTWGYGHYSRSPTALPLVITRDQAESIFADDVANRGEKWVKLYAKTDLYQCEFDALVSIAFNMSPQSYKKFANEVNAGNGIDDIAQASVGWVKAVYTNGIQNRRNAEMDVFNSGVYS